MWTGRAVLKWFLVTVIMGSNISFLYFADVCWKIFYAVPPTPQPLFLTYATNRKVTNHYLFGKCLSTPGAVMAVSLACPAIECLLLPSVCNVQITFFCCCCLEVEEESCMRWCIVTSIVTSFGEKFLRNHNVSLPCTNINSI